MLEFFKLAKFDMDDYIRRGKIDPIGFAAHSGPEDAFEICRKEDIGALMAPFGDAERLHFVATDLYTNHMRADVDAMSEERFTLCLHYHFALCERADMLGLSHHWLDVFQKR
jgi:hypothetical protein